MEYKEWKRAWQEAQPEHEAAQLQELLRTWENKVTTVLRVLEGENRYIRFYGEEIDENGLPTFSVGLVARFQDFGLPILIKEGAPLLFDSKEQIKLGSRKIGARGAGYIVFVCYESGEECPVVYYWKEYVKLGGE